MQDKTSPSAPPAPARAGKPSGFRSLVGYHTRAWQPDYAEIELALGPAHANSLGMAHGGVLMTLLDAAMGHAATYTPVPGNVRACVTLAMTTSFLEGPRGGTVRAIGRVRSVEERIATCEAELRDDTGRLLCIAQGSFRYLAGSERPEGVPKDRLRQ